MHMIAIMRKDLSTLFEPARPVRFAPGAPLFATGTWWRKC